MNREDIIRMAQEAGGEFAELPMMDAIVFSVDDRQWNSKELEAFAALVASTEREACAKIADNFAMTSQYKTQRSLAEWCASSIRARGQAS